LTVRPVVTVGLPFCDHRATLEAAVRSIFAQTLPNWTLVLVDDGSRDGSGDFAARIRDDRVTLLRFDDSAGLAARLNQIAALASTPFLARMDADDLMHPRRLEMQVARLERAPIAEVVGSATYVIDVDGRLVGIRGMRPLDLRPRSVLRRGVFVHPTISGTTSWFRRHPYDTSLDRAQDRDLWCRTFSSSSFDQLLTPLHFYREGRIDVRKYARSERALRRIARAHGPLLSGRLHTARMLLESQFKTTVYRLAGVAGLQGHLTRLRNRALQPNERAEALEALRIAQEPRLPGFRDGQPI
jgi:glycosyltransferase involved in cell wall biosynthesis